MTERVRWRRGSCVQTFAGAHPQRKIFTPPPPHRCAGAAQPYTRLCVCSGSLLTRSKWNINSSCQVPGLHRVEVQRPISSSPSSLIIPYNYIIIKILLLGEIIPFCSCCAEKGLIYIIIV